MKKLFNNLFSDKGSSNHNSDFLKEFKMHHSECNLYEITDNIEKLLQDINNTNRNETIEKISKILDQHTSMEVLHLICKKTNIKYSELFKTKDKKYSYSKAKLILHLWLLNGCYNSITEIANSLEISANEAQLLLEHLRHTFTIDNPLNWLLSFKSKTLQERNKCEIDRSKLMHGREVVNQARDTGEERRVKLRKKIMSLLFPGNR